MHLVLILITVGLACLIRLGYRFKAELSAQEVLALFLLSPLLILINAIVILVMGRAGEMFHQSAGWLGYDMALFLVIVALGWLIKLGYEGWRSLKEIRRYPQIQIGDQMMRLIDTEFLFIAQIGFWNPELVISQRLLDLLNQEQLLAVITHEQGHHYYRDTFCFFWLGWLHRFSFWLPYNEELWLELLSQREIRADAWAIKKLDPLILAETLLLLVSYPLKLSVDSCVSFYSHQNRLGQRVSAMLNSIDYNQSWIRWDWVLILFLPWVMIWFHR